MTGFLAETVLDARDGRELMYGCRNSRAALQLVHVGNFAPFTV